MFDVVTIGDATLDTFLVLEDDAATCSINKDTKHLCLHYGDKIPIVHSTQSLGGNAANVAVGLQRLGCKTAIVTELGDDMNGESIIESLSDAGIDTTHAVALKNKDTRYSVVLNYKTERTVLSAHVDRSYRLPKLPGTQWIYYTSLGKSFEGLQTKLIAHLKKNPDIQLAVNPGSYQRKKGAAALKKIFPYTTVLFVNKEEAEVLSGEHKSVQSCISALHKLGVKYVVVTDGAEGSFASDGTKLLHMPIYPITPVAKTGAGDAFASGFVAALTNGKSLEEAMQWGTANSGGVIQEFGAQKGLLNKRGIGQIMRKYKKVAPKPRT